jgi:PAS domain S-box-containing protein
MHAKSEDDLIGKSVIEFVHPDYKKLVIERMGKVAHEGQALPLIEEKFVRFDGSAVDIEVKSMPIIFDNKAAVQLIVRDITERKQAEEALRTSQEFLNSIIENSPNALWISDENGTLMRMNQACRDLIHLRDEEVVGRYNILKDNLLEEQGFLPLVKDVFEKGVTVRFVTSYDTAAIKSVQLENTTRIILDINISPILNSEGKVTNAVIQQIDITEHKRAEEALMKSKQQYDNLVAKIPVGIYILRSKLDETFALDYVSPRMAEMLNLSIDGLLADANLVVQSIHPDDRISFAKMNLEGIQLNRPFDWKGRILSKETIKWMHFRSTPEILETGDILWHGLVTDITERITADLKIHHINEELSKAIAEKDKFFSIIAHDLRSPFNIFLGFTEMLVENLPSITLAQIQEIAFSMQSSANNLFQLLENLLEWSMMQRGMNSINPKAFGLSAKITQSLLSVSELANKKDIGLSCIIPEELKVLADENMVQSIIRNLTGNAVKFTPKGGKIKVSARFTDDNLVEISVTDNGIGMGKELISKLFLLDERTSRKGTNGEPSTGLGLIICKDFVDKHGCKIWAESAKGKGSTFYFTLPVSI